MKEFFARLNPTERRFVVGVGVVFFLVINIVWVRPLFGDWGKTHDALDTARHLLAQYAAGTNNIPTLKKQIEAYKGVGSFVPPEDQIIQFFRQIQNQAAYSGVGIISMGSSRQTAAAENPFFVEQNQTIQTQSQEKNLVDFLYRLGADPNSLIRVKVLSVQPDPPRQNLGARVTLVASYQRKAPVAVAAATPAAAPKTTTPAAPAKAPNPAAGTTTSKPPPTQVAPAARPKPPMMPNPAGPRPGFPQQRPPTSPTGQPLPGQPPPGHPLQPLTPNKK